MASESLPIEQDGAQSVPVDYFYPEVVAPRKEPVLIEPPIADPEDLRNHESTYQTILTAHQILQELPPSACVIGGLAVACHVGRIYREHDDIDIAVPGEYYYRVLQKMDLPSVVGDDIYTLYRNGKRVDFFVYTKRGIGHNIEKRRHVIPLEDGYPISPVEISLAGISLRVAPRPIIVDLKAIDSSPKGILDFARLTGGKAH